MRGNTHIAFGLFSCSLINLKLDVGSSIVLGSIIGSLLPDIDTPKSTICNLLPLVDKVFNIANKLSYDLFKHRGAFTHSIWTLVMLGVLYYRFKYKLILGVILGVLGHHVLDLFSPMKLRYFYPHTIKIGFVKLGDKTEYLISDLIIIIAVIISFL